MPRCSHCGKVNREGSLFCQDCGHRLESAAAPKPAAAAGGTTCSACGTVNPPGMNFCKMCGTSLMAKPAAAPLGAAATVAATEAPVVPAAASPGAAQAAKAICPACGKGSLFRRYLKVADHCPACGEALHHQRADDAPPYFTIVIVGHIVVGLMLSVEMAYHPPLWLHATLWLPLTVLLALLLLPPIKGTLVGLQWARLMHGFDPNHKDEAIESFDDTIAAAASPKSQSWPRPRS